MTLYIIMMEYIKIILLLLLLILIILIWSWYSNWISNTFQFFKIKLNYLIIEKIDFLFFLIIFTFFFFFVLIILFIYTIFILYFLDVEKIGMPLMFLSIFVFFNSKHLLAYKLYFLIMYILGLVWFYIIYIYNEEITNLKLLIISFLGLGFFLIIYDIIIYDFFINKVYAMFNYNNKNGFSNIDIQNLINLKIINYNEINNKELMNKALSFPLNVYSDNHEVFFCYKNKTDLYNLLYEKKFGFMANSIGSSFIEFVDLKSELIEVNNIECYCIFGRLK